MPVDLKNRPDEVKEARKKIIEDLTKLVHCRCEITGIHGNTDLHEFWAMSKSVYDDEVAQVLLTHPANIVVINHDLHINKKPSFETCLATVRKRHPYVWMHFGFLNYYIAIYDFKTRIKDFYRSGQIKTVVSFIPKNK